MILESRNHHVTLTRDGEECILAFNRAHRALQLTNSSTEDNNAFDLVVLDFRMPKKDGFDLAKDILLVCPKKKIIFATAYTLDALDGLMKKVQFGMEVLQKPFDLDAFTALVEDRYHQKMRTESSRR